MSGIGDLVSGIAGLASGNNQFFNPIPAQFGGITPYQQDYAQYGYQEGLIADASEFAGSGTGQSTMATQEATGSRLGEAKQQGQMSDLDADAVLKAAQIGEQAKAGTNQLNQSSLNSLASSLGGLAGSNLLNNTTFTGGFNNPNG